MKPLAPALGLAAIVAAHAGWPSVAISQNCEAMSSGPARTDCFIGRARIEGQQSNIAAGTARRHTDTEILRTKTGTGHTTKVRRAKSKRTSRSN
jgi:hypothetical protein